MPRDALISAALRHVRDAEHLLAPGPQRSVEQALHVVGFGPECTRKGCVDDKIADHALGHDIKDAPDRVVEILLDLDPAASRYGIAAHAAQLPERANRWRPDCRYMSTTADPDRFASDVAPLVIEARAFVDGCVRALWCDGALGRDALRYPER